MDPRRKPNADIEPDIRPDLGAINNSSERIDRARNTAKELAATEGSIEASGQDGATNVASREAAAGKTPDTNIPSTFTGTKNPSQKVRLTRKQKIGIFGGSGGIIGIALFFIGGFFPLGGLLLNLGETATANRDVQSTIFSKRLYSVVDSKMSTTVTSGCSTVKIACRFSRPSNAFLDRIKDYGIVAEHADGTTIDKRPLGANEKPAQYRFTGKDGKSITVSANDFTKTLRTNLEFNKAFTRAFNMRYWGYADTFIKKLFYRPNNIDRSGKTTFDIDPNKPTESVKNIAEKGDKNNPVRNAADGEAKNDAAKRAIADAVEEEAVKTGKKVVNSKADPILTGGLLACISLNAPGFVTKVVRLYQMRQEIALAASLVIVAASALKAGDMPPETMAAIGGLLTATSIAADGSRTTSAMDSFGIKSILFNDASPANNSYKKFIPGYSVSQQFAPINEFANNDLVKNSCAAISSPEAGAAALGVEAGIGAASGGVGAVIIAAVKAAGAVLVSAGTIELFMKGLVESGALATATGAVVDYIGPENIASMLGNADIANATELDLGNAIGSGLSYFFSMACLSTGCGALTTNQLSAFNDLSQESMIAYAEQDRFGRSPFDISSPYTFLGSIAAGYYKNAYVPGNFLKTAASSIGYTLSQSFKLFSSSSYASADNLSARYNHASEFGVDSSVAIGSFGEVGAGIPAEYLNVAVGDVLASVNGAIDENSGEPKEDGEITAMLGDCGSGDLLSVKGCTITSQERANQSIYMFDLRINNVLDGAL